MGNAALERDSLPSSLSSRAWGVARIPKSWRAVMVMLCVPVMVDYISTALFGGGVVVVVVEAFVAHERAQRRDFSLGRCQVELDAAIKSLSVVAAAPELYPALVDAGAVTSLLGLLTHENTVREQNRFHSRLSLLSSSEDRVELTARLVLRVLRVPRNSSKWRSIAAVFFFCWHAS